MEEMVVPGFGCRSGLSRHHRHHNKKPSGNHSLDAHQKYLLSVYKSFQAGNEYFALGYTDRNWVIIVRYLEKGAKKDIARGTTDSGYWLQISSWPMVIGQWPSRVISTAMFDTYCKVLTWTLDNTICIVLETRYSLVHPEPPGKGLSGQNQSHSQLQLASVWHRMWIVDPDKLQKLLPISPPWILDRQNVNCRARQRQMPHVHP